MRDPGFAAFTLRPRRDVGKDDAALPSLWLDPPGGRVKDSYISPSCFSGGSELRDEIPGRVFGCGADATFAERKATI